MKNLKPRKNPAQNRSREMVDDIMEAGIRVLREEGGKGFTTIKVAKKAGVSVGSLYQYFPSKESILFKIQEKEWNETWALMTSILKDQEQTPEARLHTMIREFFRTEAEELELRKSLDDAKAECEASPAYQTIQDKSHADILEFLLELNPRLEDPEFHADFMMTVIGNVGEDISARPLREDELDRWAELTSKTLIKALRP